MTTATPAPSAAAVPDAAELVERVRRLHPLIAANAAQGEQDRRVVEETITALAAEGIFKLAQPRRYGGYEAPMRTLLDVFSAVGEADGGTSWVVTLCNGCAWFVAGMKSSGSNCLIATDVFVPEHRVMLVPPAIEGTYATDCTEESPYRSALVPFLALILAGPQLGMGRKALEIVTAKAASKPISYTFYTAEADSVAFQLQVAQAAMMIDTAQLHAYRAADNIDNAARYPPPALGCARIPAGPSSTSPRRSTSCCTPTELAASPRSTPCSASGGTPRSAPGTRSRSRRSATRSTESLLGRDDQITPLI